MSCDLLECGIINMLMILSCASSPWAMGEIMFSLSWCLEAVRVWMGENRLKLNPSKLEFLLIHQHPSLQLDYGNVLYLGCSWFKMQ